CDRFGIPPSARHHDHRRLDPEPGADPVHHAGGLSLSGSPALVVGTSAQKEHRNSRCVAAGMIVALPGFTLLASGCSFAPKYATPSDGYCRGGRLVTLANSYSLHHAGGLSRL